MQRLFLFLYQYRAFLTFLFLELFCIWLIVNNNPYQGAKFFNSSNRYAAGVLQFSGSITDYFGLKHVNEQLANENAALRKRLNQLNQSLYSLNVREIEDTQIINQYDFTEARVIKNSVRQLDNYITINKGRNNNIEPGMAVIDNHGIVGKVKTVSSRFALVTSILHTDVLVSAKIKRTGDLCTMKWDGLSPYQAKVLYVPRHIQLQAGDSIVTSGYNAVFPENIPVGVVADFELSEDSPFYDVTIDLSSDLNGLSYVYVVENNLIIELDSVQAEVLEGRR